MPLAKDSLIPRGVNLVWRLGFDRSYSSLVPPRTCLQSTILSLPNLEAHKSHIDIRFVFQCVCIYIYMCVCVCVSVCASAIVASLNH